MRVIEIEGIKIGGNNPIVLFGGPCVIENEEHLLTVGKKIKEIKQIEQEAENKVKKLEKKLHLSKKIRNNCKAIREVGWLRFYIRSVWMKNLFVEEQLLKAISKKLNVDLTIVNNLTLSEIKSLLKGQKINKKKN